jgi:hypothetical protein
MQKGAAAALWPLSETLLMDSGEGNSSQWEELQEVHLTVYFAWKENSQTWDYTNQWAVANGLSRYSGTWVGCDWKADLKKVLAEVSVHQTSSKLRTFVLQNIL